MTCAPESTYIDENGQEQRHGEGLPAMTVFPQELAVAALKKASYDANIHALSLGARTADGGKAGQSHSEGRCGRREQA